MTDITLSMSVLQAILTTPHRKGHPAMPYFKRLALLCLLHAAVFLRPAVGAEARTPALLWDRFVQALDAGHMQDAYACFSPLSRQEYSYRQFCADHHPLTMAYEAILVTPTRSEFQISGDLAELRFIAPVAQDTGDDRTPTAPQGLLVTATMVREDGAWYLVPPTRHATARLEAEARNLLRHLTRYTPGIRDALENGIPLDTEAVRMRSGTLLADTGAAHVLREYDVRTIRQGSNTLLQAWPKHAGLRAFSVDAQGTIHRPGQTRTPNTLATPSITPHTEDPARASQIPSNPAHAVIPPEAVSTTAPTLVADVLPPDLPSHAPSPGQVRFHHLPAPPAETHQPMPDPLAHASIVTDIVPPLDPPGAASPSKPPHSITATMRPSMPDTSGIPAPTPAKHEPSNSAHQAHPASDIAALPMPEPPAVTRMSRSPAPAASNAPPEAPDLRGYLDDIDLPELDIDLPVLGDAPPPRDIPNHPPKARVRVQETSVRLPPAEANPQAKAAPDTVPEDDHKVSVGILRPRAEDFMDAEWVRPVAVIGSPDVTDATYPGNLPVEDGDPVGTVSTLVPPMTDVQPLPRNEITTPSTDPWDVLDENTTIDIPGLLMPEDLH